MNFVPVVVTNAIVAAFGFAALLLGLQLLLFFPLTIVYEIRKRRALRRLSAHPFRGRVSVIVPGYNEEKTLLSCVESILASNYPDLEVIVVNDGSTDGTEQSIWNLIESGRVRYLRQSNSGKGTALNYGAAAATGDVILFTDADSLFLPETIGQMVRWFADPSIQAVCGNDTPLSARTPLQKVLAVTTHIGTGFVRRALSVLGVLPIITGNLGVIRTETFREVGGFYPIWGEDLEFTFRLHARRKQIIFDPDPIVQAECPAGLPDLWRQRIRWVRSYLKITWMHRELFRPAAAFPFSLYLPFNYFTQIVVPLLQILSVPLFFHLALSGGEVFEWGAKLILYLGLLTFFFVSLYSILLDRDPKVLLYVPLSVLVVIPLSYFYNFVVLSSIWKELRSKPERWEKIERPLTGVMSRHGGLSLALLGILLAALVVGMRFSANNSPSVAEDTIVSVQADSGHDGDLAVATHFDAWQDWRGAITSVLQSPGAHLVHTVALSAGRPEWAYFRWNGHQAQWSSLQKKESADLLGEAVHAFRLHGFRTVAIVDFYAPGLVQKEPGKAAVRFDGLRSSEQVCFSELVEGDYGQRIIEMVSYLAQNYSVDAIALTELGYNSFCFDDRCLSSYRRATGKEKWPMNYVGTTVNRSDPSVWEWRSARMEAFLEKVAKAVHAQGKQLIVDVPVSWADFRRQGKDSGLDYARVLRHADQIVIWNYFAMENRTPQVSQALAEGLRRDFAADRFYVSIGLWESQGAMGTRMFQQGLAYSRKGGASNIWITPNHLLSPEHWNAISTVVRKPDVQNGIHN